MNLAVLVQNLEMKIFIMLVREMSQMLFLNMKSYILVKILGEYLKNLRLCIF